MLQSVFFDFSTCTIHTAENSILDPHQLFKRCGSRIEFSAIYIIQTYFQYKVVIVFSPYIIKGVGLMVLNATFNNVSVISWQSVVVEETGVHGENHRHATGN